MPTGPVARFAATLVALAAASAHAQIILDDFEADSSGDYTVVNDGTPDGTVTFAYDYVAAGIGLAPNSTAGDRRGLRMTANDTAGATDAYTAFHNTAVTGSYTMLVDVWMNVDGAFGTGTTEHAHVGVGGDGSTLNNYADPSGSGAFMAMSGDGGASSDYRHFVEGVGTLGSGDPSYLDPAGSTNSSGALYQSIFPGSNGAPTNQWVEVRIDVVEHTSVTYSLNGTPIILASVPSTDGKVSLGYADVFTSVADPFQAQFVVYDNLRVVVPAPGGAALIAMALPLAARRRRAA